MTPDILWSAAFQGSAGFGPRPEIVPWGFFIFREILAKPKKLQFLEFPC
jgi:hypothetical protein